MSKYRAGKLDAAPLILKVIVLYCIPAISLPFFLSTLPNIGHVNCGGKPIHFHQKDPTETMKIDIYGNAQYIPVLDDVSTQGKYGKKSIEQDIDLDEDSESVSSSGVVKSVEFRQISIGPEASCGILYRDGNIRCWGDLRKIRITDPVLTGGPYKQVSVGTNSVCGIVTSTNRIRCFGEWEGYTGYGNIEWDQIRVGYNNACGVTMDSTLRCFGSAINHLASLIPDDFVVA
jgi:hypothetical protein